MTFKDKVLIDYPLPIDVSIWGQCDLTNLDDLIEMAVEDLQSDLEVYETMQSQGLTTHLPVNCHAIVACWLQLPFQGNKYVKWTYDSAHQILFCRYVPAYIKYKRAIGVEDLDTLKGARSQYVKLYVLIKMLEKEISYITSIKLESDIGSIDVKGLDDKLEELKTKYDDMKLDIMMYSNG